jgi:hypothetical protein
MPTAISEVSSFGRLTGKTAIISGGAVSSPHPLLLSRFELTGFSFLPARIRRSYV